MVPTLANSRPTFCELTIDSLSVMTFCFWNPLINLIQHIVLENHRLRIRTAKSSWWPGSSVRCFLTHTSWTILTDYQQSWFLQTSLRIPRCSTMGWTVLPFRRYYSRSSCCKRRGSGGTCRSWVLPLQRCRNWAIGCWQPDVLVRRIRGWYVLSNKYCTEYLPKSSDLHRCS